MTNPPDQNALNSRNSTASVATRSETDAYLASIRKHRTSGTVKTIGGLSVQRMRVLVDYQWTNAQSDNKLRIVMRMNRHAI